ncbi:hypothetical protein AWC38_SpisGene14230 [Stylophora pistillata]|uniref:Uncharacterized protein n=1 Tax=Stylophora pistillata TaxID=50429 RepID=A0A2B4RYH0_STYPI|nr:hypothetical protein AWC38_SpisGene14230 [Stylophora pistillata]
MGKDVRGIERGKCACGECEDFMRLLYRFRTGFRSSKQSDDKVKMANPVYTKEQLNYFRVCHIATNILPLELRFIFKKQWDSRYQATLGEWKDTPRNGLDFYNNESPHSQRRNARLLETVKKGSTAEWDCTTLFFAILYSDSISNGLSATLKSSVDDLREFRNENFAHLPWGQLSELEFKLAVVKVKIAFSLLGLSTTQVHEISKQGSFQTEEVENLRWKCEDLHKELEETKVELETAKKQRQLVEEQLESSEKQRYIVEEQLEISEERREVLEVQLKDDISSFCILPSKPSHEIATRDDEVAEVIEDLDQLKRANENRLNYLYITGNPGSGKSQLAGLVAEKFYKKVNSEISPSFVMTLNAENLETLLESYVTLARQVKCPEYGVMDTRRRDRDGGNRDKRKNGGVAIFVRNHLKVLSVERNEAFELINVKLLLPSEHHMLVVGVYHPPSLKYSECDLIDCIIEPTDEFLDCFPDGVILCGGDLNQLDLYSLTTLSGLVKLVGFPNRGDATCDCTAVLNAPDIDGATNTLNESLLSLLNTCFPVRNVTLSSRDSPWMAPLVKYLLKKKLTANASRNVARATELSRKVSELIAENRMNWGRAEATGTM